MVEPSDINEGYLVIADISGFTPYLAEAELDHASDVMRQVLACPTESLVPPARLAEVEGDAVFVYLDADENTRGELIAEIVEACYAAFRDLRATMERNATCPCRACLRIPSLDLKFVVHRGRYVLQDLADRVKPVGSDVNLAHRLLKNHVADETGWGAYVLYTQDAIEHVGLDGACMRRGTEAYEHLGSVSVFAEDLAERYELICSGRRAFVAGDDADAQITHDFDALPATLWDWLNDPKKRNLWMDRAAWSARKRPAGRLGAGAENHCSNYKVLEQIDDYRPFEYYTFRYLESYIGITGTVELEPVPTGTRLTWRMQITSPMPRWLKRFVARYMVHRYMELGRSFSLLDSLLVDHAAATV